MDILKDFKHFFYGGGLNNLIHRFRNPTEEEFVVFNTKYISATDTRESYDSELEDTAINPKSVYPFSNWLNYQFEEFKKELKTRCENLISIGKDDRDGFIEKTLKVSDFDFTELRQKILNDRSLKRYQEDLLLFVTDIEGIFKTYGQNLPQKNKIERKAGRKSVSDVPVSFGFNGKSKMLEELYFELMRHDFIDEKHTPKTMFVELLAADNFHDVVETVRFKCQTRQAAYIITQLVRFSTNPEIQFFADTGKFKNKKGEPLTANNIYKSVSSSNFKPVASKDIIDEIFSSL